MVVLTMRKDIKYHQIETRADRIRWMLKMLLDDEATDWDSLTDWEQQFVEKMEHVFNKNGDLTENQFRVLEEIYDKE